MMTKMLGRLDQCGPETEAAGKECLHIRSVGSGYSIDITELGLSKTQLKMC